MPRCPLNKRQCSISSQSTPYCPLGFAGCPLNVNQFTRSELKQEVENWNRGSLQTVLERSDSGEKVTIAVRLLKSEIESGFLEPK